MMTREEIERVFRKLWTDEQLARHVPLRVEVEHVTVFGTVAEAIRWAGGFGGDTGRGRNKRGWGSIVRVDPLASDDPIDPRRSTASTKNPLHSVSVWKRGDKLNG